MTHDTSALCTLIVDDDPVSRRWLAGCLAREGIASEEVSDAESARRALARGGHGVVLLDLFLGSGASGLDVLTWMREQRALDDVGVIIVSANAGDESAVALALQRGADDYVVKPVRPVELGARARAVRRRSTRRSEVASRDGETEVEGRLQHAMQLETVGRLAGGIAHDFNNLLTGITSNAHLGLDDAPDGSAAREALEEIRRAAATATALTKQLASFARTPTVEPTLLDPNDLIESLRKMLRRLLGDDIRLVFTPRQQHGIVRIDPVQLELALVNLALNARHAMPRGGELRLETRELGADAVPSERRHGGARRFIRIDVSDTGHGMSAEVRDRVFEPFFTTKPRGSGTGYGLANVRRFVEDAGGWIDVASTPGRGTSFQLYLPRERTTALTPSRELPARPSLDLAGKAVLVVEDDELVRSASVRILRRSGAEVLVATSAPHAVGIAREPSRMIDLVLTDVVMPDMSGPEVARHIRALRPGLPFVCASGHGEEELLEHGVRAEDALVFLPKPFTPAALLAKVSEALAASAHAPAVSHTRAEERRTDAWL
jgi:signal transduction histidine kinase